MRNGSLMREKRRVERFELHIETLCKVHDEGIGDETHMLLTNNISSEGAFLRTTNPLPVGTNIDLNFLLSQEELSNDTDDQKINIWTSGKVVRTDEMGMAVEFEKLYKVSQLK